MKAGQHRWLPRGRGAFLRDVQQCEGCGACHLTIDTVEGTRRRYLQPDWRLTSLAERCGVPPSPVQRDALRCFAEWIHSYNSSKARD